MKACTLLRVSFALLVAAPVSADPILMTTSFNADFVASRSLWSGGPGAGLDKSGSTSGDVGLYYSVRANTGTVDATQNAGIVASFLSETIAGGLTTISLDFSGDPSGGTVQSRFGANAQTGVFLDKSGCFGGVVAGNCIGIRYDIDETIAVIDEGFFLNPTTTHTPVIDTARTANAAAQTFGVGGADLVIGKVGPTMNLDLEQNIRFTPTGLSGLAFYENQVTGQTGSMAFTIPTDGPFSLNLNLGAGVWDVTFQNITLLNSFRNDINLELRPAFDYVVGSWPPPGEGLFSFDLIDETFALGFNTIQNLGSIQVTVLEADSTAVPEPGSLLLLALSMGALVSTKRPRLVG